MSRNVPGAMQTHLDLNATTTTRLLKIITRTGEFFGMAMINEDITYDDLDGEVIYRAMNGFDPTTISADIGFSIDNAEGYSLMGATGITPEMVNRGDLDDAQWIMYLVNFRDLTPGRHVILDAGDVGDVRTRYGMVWIPELLSYGMRLKQTIGSVWSRQCRAIFGTPAASQTGCGVAISGLWVTGTVVDVGEESNRVFTGTTVIGSNNIVPFPGRVQWLTGQNAGREFATEEVGEYIPLVILNETTAYPIEVGDTYRIRPDCRKRYREDCIGIWSNGPNFKGEPLIPVGDATQIQTPGAQLPNTGGWDGGTTDEGDAG